MASDSKIRAFVACSLDGFIAGLDDDLSWLPGAEGEGGGDDAGYEAFMAQIGALLMGRRTYEVVAGFGLPSWPFGERPVLVATHRPLFAGVERRHGLELIDQRPLHQGMVQLRS